MSASRPPLKNRLGRYLAAVRGGDTVQVTDRGRPIACLAPSGEEVSQGVRVLTQVAAKGGVCLGTGTRMPHRRPVPLKPGTPVVEMVADQRR